MPVIKIPYVLDKSLFLYPKSLFYDGNLQFWQNIVFNKYCEFGQNVHFLHMYLECICHSLVWMLSINRGETHSSYLRRIFLVGDRIRI